MAVNTIDKLQFFLSFIDALRSTDIDAAIEKSGHEVTSTPDSRGIPSISAISTVSGVLKVLKASG